MQLFNLPIFLTIEESIINRLGKELEIKIGNLIKRKTMLFTSEGNFHRYKYVIEKLKDELKNISLYFVKDSSYDIAVEAAKTILIEDYELIIGFGGGKVLDTAKYAAYVSKKKYISIPTILSNDGVASPIAVLKTTNGRAKSFGCKVPDGIIIDVNIVKEAPDNLLMAGVGDTVSNYTALYDWKLQCEYEGIQLNDFAYLLSDAALNLVLYTTEKN